MEHVRLSFEEKGVGSRYDFCWFVGGLSLGLKRMFEGSIPSLAGANSNGEKLERTFVKHSKKNQSSDKYWSVSIDATPRPLSRVRPVNRQLRAGPKCKKLRVKLRTVAVGANCEGLHSSKSHKSNCSPVEVHFF